MAGIFSKYFSVPRLQKPRGQNTPSPSPAPSPAPPAVAAPQPVNPLFGMAAQGTTNVAPQYLPGTEEEAGLGVWLQQGGVQEPQAVPAPPVVVQPPPAPLAPFVVRGQASVPPAYLPGQPGEAGLQVFLAKGLSPQAQAAQQVAAQAVQQAQQAAQAQAVQQAQQAQGAIPYPPVDQPNGQQMADWLLKYGNSGGTIAAPGAEIPEGTQVAPGVTQPAAQPEPPKSPAKDKGEGPKADTPVKPDERGAMFLMRPRGLSGPDGPREEAQPLVNYDGLAKNAQSRRLTWDEYNKLTEEERRTADLNKLLINSREDDLTRKGDLGVVEAAQYYANVADVFGPGGTQSKTTAPRTVDLLASIDYDAVGKDLDDFLSLKEGISVKEQKKGGADRTAADAVQTRAKAAFEEKGDEYWNLNSAVRDNTQANKRGKAPAGWKGKEPETDEDGNVLWTKDFLYSQMYDRVRDYDPEWEPKQIEGLLKSLNFTDDDMRELGQHLYLRAQNDKLYAPGTSETMSEGGKKRRTPDEIIKFLGLGG